MDEADIRAILSDVRDPILEDDIVSLGLVNAIEIEDDTASISLALGAPYSGVETEIASEVRERLSEEGISVELTAGVQRDIDEEANVLPNVKNVIAISSGKGGVGKSTVSVNVATQLANMGARVGLFDADVYGPNVPRMLASEDTPGATEDETIVPPEKYGVKLMSMDFLVGKDDPVIWRGPMVHKVITQLVDDVEWGALDYFVIDLPPGTGDTQLTVLQSLPLTGAVVVTTPQEVAVDDARKGLRMFSQHDTNVLGIIENMSSFVCPDCGSEHDVFGKGGGEEFATEVEMPFLGRVPLDPRVREGTESGDPIVMDSDSAAGEALREITSNIADNVGVVARRNHIEAAKAKVNQ